MKRVVNKFLMIFTLIIILTGIISADGCEIRLRTNCQTAPWDNIVMGLSSSTNAHGEFPDIGTYNYVLCCDFGGGDTICNDPITPTNKMIGLSSETNAHAEIPEEENYEIDVCYDGLKCKSTIEGCDADYPLEIFSLSGDVNAHIGTYGRNICCNKIECRDGEVNYCSDYYQGECDFNPCEGVAELSVESNNPDITCNEGYDCKCEYIEESCVPTWEAVDQDICGDNLISQELGETCDGTEIPFTDCSGNVDTCIGGIVSCYPPGSENECTLDVSGCTGCAEGGECGDSEINNFPFESCDGINLNSKTCGDFSLLGEGLSCYPLTHSNNCTFDTTACEPLESHPSKIGRCSYEESTEDNCDDKFLTYSWTATWIWDEENSEHYDPNNAAEKCVGGSNTVPCPAQIELPFFGSYSIIIIIGLITLIYVFMNPKKGKKIFKKIEKKKAGSKRKG